ncbi:MAG TPA: phosphatidylglycerophosphatase A [Alphaproteobacteria bacterium]|nr:phosphatidylglycerophosphatase A [Alphaproteobacteria bacterium]
MRLQISQPALPFWHPATLVGTWFGAGLLPIAPGTWGSLAALPFGWLIRIAGGSAALLVAAGIVFALGWWATARYKKETEVKDPSEIVVDEVSAQWLTLLVADPGVWWHWLLGFLLFRLCDIVKPWPANAIDRRGSALAVMADDTVAAIYALFILAIVIFARGLTRGA